MATNQLTPTGSATPPAAPGTRSQTGRRFGLDPTILTFVILIGLWAFSLIRVEGFRTVDYNLFTLRVAAFLGVVAAGQTLVVLMGGIDLSVSAVVTMAGVLGGIFITDYGQFIGITLTLLAAIVVGVANGIGVSYLRLPPLVMTLASLSVIQGILLVYNAGKPVSGKSSFLTYWALDKLWGIPTPAYVVAAVTIIALVLLHSTAFGRGVYAVGNNPRAALLSGVPIARIQIATYSLCSVCACITGLLLLGRTGYSSKTAGDPYQLMSIAAVVIGGTSILGGRGKFIGTIGGALVLTIIVNVLTVENIPESGRMIIQGGLILGLLIAYAYTDQQ